MNPRLDLLQPYPFEKLAKLKAGVTPPNNLPHISLSIGEPKHAPPEFVISALRENMEGIAHYPLTKGTGELRNAIADWTNQRFKLAQSPLDSETQIIPVNGTREALFAFAQAIVDTNANNPVIASPNPFYQIYEGAAILAGATPFFLNCTEKNHFIPEFDEVEERVWQDCQLIYLCSPGNPTGAVINKEQMTKLIELADQYDFIIASDECYSELYFEEDTPPTGLLEVCHDIGRLDYDRCVVFHSLSKRSNLPGLRSGFVAGDAKLISKFLLYRTYHGCAMPVQTQMASTVAWGDEQHVKKNRDLYREKFSAVIEILKDTLPVKMPDASFYLWPKTPIADPEFAQGLYAQQNVTVLPGSFLSRDNGAGNPGDHHIRMALVATVEECIEAAHRIKQYTQSLV